MKNPYLIPCAAILLLAATGCDKHSPDVAKKIAELEQKNQAATDRQRELEQELEDQKLAAERDAIERERVRIEDDRAELNRQQGAAAAEQDQALRDREAALSNREGMLEKFQSTLEEKEDDLHQKTQQLSDRDRELAGREALSVEQPVATEPVADYGMFYDSLSPYGSWFETADYGYVWQPVIVSNSNWRPYSRGRWACSDRGWNWISEEPFGWATYHYGRWTLLRDRGWIWVPGAEWAPCWVSWRENNSHIGWAPLPPETLAYRGHNWDSSVDVQFGIGALCYNFVEMRYFGSSLYSHCLPISANGGYFQQTANITYIHIENRQVICGGPKYKNVCKGVGRDLPFYRLQIEPQPRPTRDSTAMRPRIKGDHLVVSAPNMDVAWNDNLKPKRIKDRLENVTVERDGNLGREITDRYRQSREDGRQKAEAAVVALGGAAQFDQRREEKLQDNRRQVEGKGRKEVTRDVAKNPQREIPNIHEPDRMARPADPDPRINQTPDRVVRQPNENRPRAEVLDDRRSPAANDTPRVAPNEPVKPRPESRPQQPADDRRVARTNDSVKQVETSRDPQRQVDPAVQARKEAVDRKQDDQAREMQRQAKQNDAEQSRQTQQDANKLKQVDQAREMQRQAKQNDAEQARQAQQEANQRKLDEQAQQQQARAQREAEQAREAQKDAIRQQREQELAQRQQQALAQQREQERAQRQQQEAQQQEMQRQQDRAQQRQQEQENARQQQQEQARQRQQDENQRQQENQRQEQSRQRQQDDSRQKQENDQKDQDDQRKKGR